MPISREIYPFLDTIATKICEYLARPEINLGLENLGYVGEFLVEMIQKDLMKKIEQIKEKKYQMIQAIKES